MRILLTALLCTAALFAAEVNRPAPRFRLPDVNQKDHDSIDYRGKVVVLEFMRTDCPHCAAFSSVLKQVQQRYGARVVVVALVNPPVTPADVSTFIALHQVSYPILLDAGRVAYAYIQKGAFDLPYLFLIDAGGIIREEYEFSPATVSIFQGNALFPRLDSLLGGSFGAPAGKK